jgi:hypothetical protein
MSLCAALAHLAAPHATILHKMQHSRGTFVQRAARAGYLTKAAVYSSLGALAIAAAIGVVRADAAEPGTFQALLRQPFGWIALIIAAAGLAAFGLWRLVQALFDPEHRGTHAKALWLRLWFLASGIAHFCIAFGAIRLLVDVTRRHKSGAKEGVKWLMAQPYGPWLVGALGVGVCIFALAQLYRAVRTDFTRQLDITRLGARACRAIVAAARTGVVGRAILFAILGILLIGAAIELRPTKARSMGESLRFLEMQPYGAFLLALAAIGLLSFGVYMAIQARYRIIPAVDGTAARRRLREALPGAN